MALKFRHLSVPQAKQALRHRVSQSSHERRDAVGQCGHDTSRHSRLQLDTIAVIADIGGGIGTQLASILDASPASKGILFDKPHLRAELRHRSLSCVFCRNMNSNVSVELDLSERMFE